MERITRSNEVIGIDLGTTNTVVASLDATGTARVIPNLDGDDKTPSVVWVSAGGDEDLIGAHAKEMRKTAPDCVFFGVKRDVGADRVYATIGGVEVTPEHVHGRILTHIRLSAIEFSGDDNAGRKAVITVPAGFNEKQRQSVRRSAQMAGIEVIAIINEPTAACLAHGVQHKQGDRKVAVIDFGGGTLDVSIAEYAGSEINVLGSHGDNHLGGEDIEDILKELVRQAFRDEHSLEVSPEKRPVEWYTICEEIVRQKHMLSRRTEATITARVDGKQVVIPITRERFAQLIKPIIDRCRAVAVEAIGRSKVDPAEIDHVLLVGGSSRVAAFREMAERLFGADKVMGGGVSPDLAIAEGAAIHAALTVSAAGERLVDKDRKAIPLPCIKTTDVTPHPIGVAVQDPVSGSLRCSVVLEANQPTPIVATKQYRSVTAQQDAFEVFVLQGEDDQRLDDCLVVAQCELKLPPRDPSEPSLDVTMNYDASGMVTVTVNDLVSGRSDDITVDHFKRARRPK